MLLKLIYMLSVPSSRVQLVLPCLSVLHRCAYDFLFKIILPLFIIGIKVTQGAYENIYEDVNGLLRGTV